MLDVFISSAYAQTSAIGGAQSGLMGMLFPLLLVVVMFVVVVWPQMKKQKELKAMNEGLAKGDEVVTNGGMLGKVTKINETIVHLEVSQGTEIQVQRSAIVQVLPKGTLK
jgi:preprotein translocase subunit YajC